MRLALRSLASELRITARNFRDYLRREAIIRRKLKAARPLLIYQAGKVGSSSFEHSLFPAWPGLMVHAHAIDPHPDETFELIGMRELVYKKKLPINIISLVREPIGRNVSAFFQNFDKYLGGERQRGNLSVDELINVFFEKYPHDVALSWYDRRMKADFGIDVYDYPFPDAGVQVIEKDHVRLLLMRSEVDDETKETAVRDFLGLKEFQLKRANSATQKAYFETYRSFKSKFVPPDWYIERMYESRYFKHFYAGYKPQFVANWKRVRPALAA
jgi:hypothetical protein